MRIDQRNERRQVPFGAAFAQKEMQTQPELLPRLGQFGGFVIGLNAGQHVGVQIAPRQPGRVAVNVFALAGLDLGQFARFSEIDARIVH